MTEIPEHLLKRSQERRAALGLGGGDSGEGDAGGGEAAASGATPAESAGAVEPAAAAAPAPAARAQAQAPAEPPPPPPDPPVVAAAKARRRVPYWAMPVLAALPFWGFLFMKSIEPPPADENDPLVIGEEVYGANCAGCHGSAGEGGSGPKLADGEVLATFPDPLAMARWVTLGSNHGGADANGNYGDPNRPGGQRNIETIGGVMPGAEADLGLTPDEVAAVVRHERETLSGEEAPEPGEELTGAAITAYIEENPPTE